jgi:hypothetical protein
MYVCDGKSNENSPLLAGAVCRDVLWALAVCTRKVLPPLSGNAGGGGGGGRKFY